MSKVYQIKDIAKLNKSSLLKEDNYTFINYLDTSSISKNIIDKFQHLSNNFPSRAKRKIEKNTIIYSTVRPNQEHYGIFEEDNPDGNIIISTGFTTIDVISNEIDSKYLYYKLIQKEIIGYLHTIAEGAVSSYPSITPSDIGNLKFTFPNITTQKQIATFLSLLDAKIVLNNKINRELEVMIKTLYDYWFVQFDFPNEEGNPYKSDGGKMVYNEVLKKKIPEGWSYEQINDLGTIIGGSTPSKAIEDNFTTNGIPWITPKDLSENISKKFITKGELDITEKGLKEASLSILPAKSVLMSSRAPIGYLAINRANCTTNQGFKSIICNKGYANEYVFYVLKNYMPVIEANASGSTFKEISASVLKSIKILKPKEEIVDSFIKKVKVIFERQDNIEKQNQELNELREWLLPMLMNGQIKIADTYNGVVTELPIAVELKANYLEIEQLNIPDNKKGFAKQVLAGKIVSIFKEDPNFTHIKFQKIQFLAEHIIEADLNLNYYYQAAGPYDNMFMKNIYENFRRQKWFDSRNKQFITLEKQEKIEDYYQGYFAPAQKNLNRLFELLYDKSEAEAEIIATIYAVWNNRIINNNSVSENELIADFYKWSPRKQQYSEEKILTGLKWLKDNQMEPKGFGKLIKTAKDKK